MDSWYRIVEKTWAKRYLHCQNADGKHGQWRTKKEWTAADWNK
jgi:hypothetical protein